MSSLSGNVSEVEALLLDIGRNVLKVSPALMRRYVNKLVIRELLTTVEQFQTLTDLEWIRLGLPLGLEKAIRHTLTVSAPFQLKPDLLRGLLDFDPPEVNDGQLEIPAEIVAKLFPVNRGGTIPLYPRSAISALAQLLKGPNRIKHIKGPPGTGKSTSTFALLYRDIVQGRRMEKVVIWIQCKMGRVALLRNGSVKAWITTDPFSLLKTVLGADLLALGEGVSIVFDQFTRNDYRSIELFKDLSMCSTMPITVIASDGSLELSKLYDEIPSDFVMPGWTREEYIQAIGRNERIATRFKSTFTQTELMTLELPDLVDRKMFFSGISCRYMLDLTVAEIRSQTQVAISSVPDMLSLKNLNVGSGSVDAINRLFHSVGSLNNPLAYGFSSDYIAQTLGLIASREAIKTLYANSERANGYDGKVAGSFFEAFLVASLTSENFKFTGIPYGDGGIVVNYSTSQQRLGVWQRPTDCNAAGYDIVRVDKESSKLTITFLQATTMKKKHKLKPEHFLATAKEIMHLYAPNDTQACVNIVFIVPTTIETQFDWKWESRSTKAKARRNAGTPIALASIDPRWSNESIWHTQLGVVRGLEGAEVFKRA